MTALTHLISLEVFCSAFHFVVFGSLHDMFSVKSAHIQVSLNIHPF